MLTLDNHPAVETISEELRKEIEEAGDNVSRFSLADAIRLGSNGTEQARNWGDEGSACALSAAALACKAKGLA